VLCHLGVGHHQVRVVDLWIRDAHLEAVLVSDGDQVTPRTVLGLEGSAGFTMGPHLDRAPGTRGPSRHRDYDLRVLHPMSDDLRVQLQPAHASRSVANPRASRGCSSSQEFAAPVKARAARAEKLAAARAVAEAGGWPTPALAHAGHNQWPPTGTPSSWTTGIT